MTKDEIKEALRGRMKCIHTKSANSSLCDDGAAGGHDAGYMASCKVSACHLMGEIARGTTCSGCVYTCGRWTEKLQKCRDDGEVREVLRKACVGWTPATATNQIPGEAV